MTTRRIEHRRTRAAAGRAARRAWLRSRTASTAWVAVVLAASGGCALTAPDGPGTRADPTPVGEAVPVGPYSVSVGRTTIDALDAVLAADPANSPPPPGRQFVMAPLTVSLDEATSGVPWEDIAVRFVTADGDVFGAAQQDQCGAVPAALAYVGAVPQGTPVPGNVCVSVPSEEADDGGRWLVKEEGSLTGWSGYHEVLAAAPTGGTRAAPTPVDVPTQIGSYVVSVGPSLVDLDGTATAVGPAAGQRHVLVPMTVTNAGPQPGNPWASLDVRLVSPRGAAVGIAPEDQCGVPDALAAVGDVTPGATVTGNVCVSAPVDDLDGWTWLVQQEGSLSGLPAFFSAR